MRTCTKCKETKPLDQFGRYSLKSKPSRAGKLHSHCRACKNHARRLKNRGLTDTQFNALVKAQHGRCFLCKAATELHIDHNHRTGKARKLLCNTCNWRIGMLETAPPGWLAKASKYIDDL